MEIEAFLSANPAEIVTLILEDYVEAPNGLTNVFKASGLMKYWFPVTSMPKNGQDWPLVSDMVAKNQRLLVFTSKSAKEQSEGIAYQWNYMVENQCKNPSTNFKYFSFLLFLSLTLNTDGDGGMKPGNCPNRGESAPLNDKTKSLVLVNYFSSIPIKQVSCAINSGDLIKMLYTCYGAAGNRWANFVAVDFYKACLFFSPQFNFLVLNETREMFIHTNAWFLMQRSEGGGSFQALDTLNGELLCGCNDVHACVVS